MELLKFEGNCPRNVAKDAKYSVKFKNGNQVVGLLYRDPDGSKWKPTTTEHPDLVAMVNEVKQTVAGSRGGPFYINEYKQVIVPTMADREYYLAGEYEQPLLFELHGRTFSGDAVDLKGQPLSPGESWEGPHPGIPYVLSAGAKDIRYTVEIMEDVTKDVFLSKQRDQNAASRICRQIAQVKGLDGGRFYINEYCQLFTSINADGYVEYQYIGRLESLDDWFLKPHA